jgi:hypothetical protein
MSGGSLLDCVRLFDKGLQRLKMDLVRWRCAVKICRSVLWGLHIGSRRELRDSQHTILNTGLLRRSALSSARMLLESMTSETLRLVC